MTTDNRFLIVVLMCVVVYLSYRIEQVNRLHFEVHSLDRRHSFECDKMIVGAMRQYHVEPPGESSER